MWFHNCIAYFCFTTTTNTTYPLFDTNVQAMATMSLQSFTKVAAAYGKRVESNTEKIIAQGTVETKILNGYRSYNGDGYSTLFVDLKDLSIAIDSKVQLPEVIDSFDIAVVTGEYKGEAYSKIRILRVR